jgi:hypothetical protein
MAAGSRMRWLRVIRRGAGTQSRWAWLPAGHAECDEHQSRVAGVAFVIAVYCWWCVSCTCTPTAATNPAPGAAQTALALPASTTAPRALGSRRRATAHAASWARRARRHDAPPIATSMQFRNNRQSSPWRRHRSSSTSTQSACWRRTPWRRLTAAIQVRTWVMVDAAQSTKAHTAVTRLLDSGSAGSLHDGVHCRVCCVAMHATSALHVFLRGHNCFRACADGDSSGNRPIPSPLPLAHAAHFAGAPMGCAPIAHVLFSKIMKYNPANPKWVRDDAGGGTCGSVAPFRQALFSTQATQLATLGTPIYPLCAIPRSRTRDRSTATGSCCPMVTPARCCTACCT